MLRLYFRVYGNIKVGWVNHHRGHWSFGYYWSLRVEGLQVRVRAEGARFSV